MRNKLSKLLTVAALLSREQGATVYDIMNEVDPITNENPIYIGLSKHNEYDETDEFLYSMEESDFFKVS